MHIHISMRDSLRREFLTYKLVVSLSAYNSAQLERFLAQQLLLNPED